MSLYVFNIEFEEGSWTDKLATYVEAETLESAVLLYKKGPNNNDCIWSVKNVNNNTVIRDKGATQ